MPRARKGPASRRAKNRVLKKAKGYYGGRSRLLRTAKEATAKAAVYATRDRQQRKRDFRRLWIARLSAAAKRHSISYSRLMNGLRKAQVQLNRKVLADLAVSDPTAFNKLVDLAASPEGQTSTEP